MSEAQSVLYDIKPCDLQQPYIFVSYSSMDSELVWRDVREFQRRGYNVWLDEKNLDKTKLSWRDDAIEAIEDMECELVVFYVSSHSLRSDACYQELSKTIDERTQAMHFGPVKFIAIDAEPVGDITEFSQKVFREIRGSVMQKEERNRQALALDGFMRNFFNSNNEKVRIHPKDEPGRKIDYYDDITASFPEITKIYESEPVQETADPGVVSREAADPEAVSREMLADILRGTADSKGNGGVGADINKNLWPNGNTGINFGAAVNQITDKSASETAEKLPRFTKPEENSEMNWGRNVLAKKEALALVTREGTLEIPMGYTEIQILIKRSVFWGNEEIINLVLPDSMQELNSSQFKNCKNIRTVRLSGLLTEIPFSAFENCESLVQVVIPGNVTVIGSNAFTNCTSLQSLILPEGLIKLDMSAFENCVVLQRVYLPGHLEKMGIRCFQGCAALTEVTIPGSLKVIPSGAFSDCAALNTIMIEDGVEKIEPAFENCGSDLVHIWIPDSVKKIASIAF